jgi:hypothetical protein
MKLIRFGDDPGKEHPGLLLNDGTRVDVSEFSPNGFDYDEACFSNDGDEYDWIEESMAALRCNFLGESRPRTESERLCWIGCGPGAPSTGRNPLAARARQRCAHWNKPQSNSSQASLHQERGLRLE